MTGQCLQKVAEINTGFSSVKSATVIWALMILWAFHEAMCSLACNKHSVNGGGSTEDAHGGQEGDESSFSVGMEVSGYRVPY